MECIILAGGLGTRLSGIIGAIPKCMAPVAGKPFLAYLLDYLAGQGCTKAILSLGYKHEWVEEWLSQQHYPFALETVVERTPLGTGGGMMLALKKAGSGQVFILNGDTMFRVNLRDMLKAHSDHAADLTIALKHMEHFERYGVVHTDTSSRIRTFEEKKPCDRGWINGGVYVVNTAALVQRHFPEAFSFEKDYMKAFVSEGKFYACRQEGYFIDIGVPEDYQQAQTDFLSF